VRREANELLLENSLSGDLNCLSDYEIISHYETRAWAYQKRTLSRRCLFFHEREALLIVDGCKASIGVSCLESDPTGRCLENPIMNKPEKNGGLNLGI